MHEYQNELLKTDPNYYKNSNIEPVLNTINDKFCKVMLEAEEHVQQTPHQAQSPDDIEDGEEFVQKLDDFDEFFDDAQSAITTMFSQIQLCHNNLEKLARHMAMLGKKLTPA